jgi:hypothetical protein
MESGTVDRHFRTDFAQGIQRKEGSDAALPLGQTRPASAKNPAGKVELGYVTKDLKEVYANREKMGIEFTSEPKPLHGMLLADIVDSEGARCSLGEELSK